MPLTLIEGRSGAGKTDAILSRMVEGRKMGRNGILLVPEQMTYEMEIELMERLGSGFLGSDVLSMPRLARRVFESAGGQSRTFLSSEGRRMALRKIISEKQASLLVFRQRGLQSGLAESIEDMICQCKRAEISAAMLEQQAQSLQDSLLRSKMLDLSILYAALDDFMQDRYIDSEDQLALLVERMPDSDFLQRSDIFIDSFFGHQYTEQSLSIIGNLLRISPSVMIALRIPEPDSEDAAIFYSEMAAKERILQTAEEIGLSRSEIFYERLPNSTLAQPRNATAAIHALNPLLYSYEKPTANIPSEGISLLRSERREEEVQAAAQHINSLLRSGAKARDIAIAVGDISVYAPLLERALAPLPLYIDQKRPLASHSIVALTMASLPKEKAISLEQLLIIAKSGLFAVDAASPQSGSDSGISPLDPGDMEALERYGLRYGYRYQLQDDERFARSAEKAPDLYEAANRARLALLSPLLAFHAALKRAKTAEAHCRALFDYYESIHVRASLEAFCREWEDKGEYDVAAENAQVWMLVLALLDQIALLLDGPMPTNRFAQVLKEGFESQSIGMVPTLRDQIAVGEVPRLCQRNGIKHLLVLGCNEGSIPASPQGNALIDDTDIELLEEAELPLFQNSRSASTYARQCVYALFCRAEQSLWVSHALSDQSGKPLFPALIYGRLTLLFPEVETMPLPIAPDSAWTERAGFACLLEQLRKSADGTPFDQNSSAHMANAYSYYQKHVAWEAKLDAADHELFPHQARLRADARPLFALQNRESTSRIESFNRCPFQHFVRHGMRPDDTIVLREENSDVGNYYHDALDRFTQLVLNRELDWARITQDDCDALIDEVSLATSAEHNEGILQENATGRAQERQIRRTLRQSAWAMVQQIRGGEFRPYSSEIQIGDDLPGIELTLSDGQCVELRGQIDRIDVFQNGNTRYIRIIDYKSGSQEFSFAELFHGLKLQLPLYMTAALSLGEAGGIFYLHIQDAYINADSPQTLPYEEALLQKYRLSGILLLDKDGVIPDAMDKELRENGSSLLVPLSLNKKTGEFTKASLHSALTESQMNIVLDFSREKAVSSIEAIRKGITDVLPYRDGDKTGCDWCAYASICRFEKRRGGQYHSIDKMKKDEFFSATGKTLPPNES